jgi:hypothetical protein
MRAKSMVLAAGIALLVGITGAASASTIITEPAGPVRAVSVGRFTFVGGLLPVACNLVLSGTVTREATGTLTERPEPTINPVLGSWTSGAVSECSLGTTVTLLFADGLWKYEGYRHREEIWEWYILHVLYLVETSNWACLFDALVTVTYNERTGEWRVNATEYLRVTSLRGVCGVEQTAGTFRMEPRLTARLV